MVSIRGQLRSTSNWESLVWNEDSDRWERLGDEGVRFVLTKGEWVEIINRTAFEMAVIEGS